MNTKPGLSGMAVYLPPYRVRLEDWCDWNGQQWDKIRSVVGHSFRMSGPWENVYTMAAAAVLRLIRNYEIDASRVRYLALGTESSTDNSAGAVVIKGLVNQALDAHGRPRLARACEVPEFKHACLGGVYGMKGAARFLACEPEDSLAIVVAADVAEYARGSSGEPTQGAGAVAMLIDHEARLASLDVGRCGSASDYRIVDFRKPVARIAGQPTRRNGQVKDFPVFNGKYSTTCYVDATLHAVSDLFQRRAVDGASYLRERQNIFMHRPYRRMPETGLAMCYLMALARGTESERAQLAAHAADAGADPEGLVTELSSSPDLSELVRQQRINDEAYPNAMLTLKGFRRDPGHAEVLRKLDLGADSMMDIGNLYTAALPAWVAAGFEDAAMNGKDLTGQEILLLGYGSGDAAEALPIHVSPDWRDAAGKVGFARALEGAFDLNAEQYASLHDHGHATGLEQPALGFRLERMGEALDGPMLDYGIEYYRYDSR